MPPTDLRDVDLKSLLRELDRRFVGDGPPIDLSGVSSRALTEALLRRMVSVHGSSDLVNVPARAEELPPRLGVVFGNLDLDPQNAADYLRELRADEEGVAILFDRAELGEIVDDHYLLRTKPLREHFDLCDPRFAREPCLPGARGSGFLVARYPRRRRSRWLVTASHCIAPQQIASTVVTFAFGLESVQDGRVRIPADEVYELRAELVRCADDDPADWAIFELDREVVGRTIRPLATEPIAALRPVHIAGHPLGLPRKLAGNAVVRDNSAADHFKANLDAYGGNSGSPIFDAETHAIVGLLVSGQEDLMPSLGCKLDQCMLDQCPGETCTRAALFADYVPYPES
ncbi:Trypsin-like peptidase domain-containing protein [Nannocystis exedens]|uniref:Trypsin-like peptidase domain-containing protein n=1 Tax=Nannocystis exedens TaxID=54 RepID=A0A1I2ENT2_9BACT|nr:serine protease [Nannocystis exedens]PCC73887.1 peptidase S1 and S6 chymotrypsin/Hap [Nannocystis exedens]SFE94764.1 Trypsin-like peptidase domain-containing protein [Nannocystis exedens]